VRNPHSIDALKQVERFPRAALAAFLLAGLAVAIVAGNALAASTNLVKNGSFEKDSNGDGVPNQWTGINLTPADKRVCNQSKAGSCSFKMVGDGTTKYLYQVIAVSGGSGNEFNLSAWTKGKNITGGLAYVYVQFNHTGGGDNNVLITIPAGTSPWTLRQEPATAAADFDSITIALQLNADSGKVWVDKVKLVLLP